MMNCNYKNFSHYDTEERKEEKFLGPLSSFEFKPFYYSLSPESFITVKDERTLATIKAEIQKVLKNLGKKN